MQRTPLLLDCAVCAGKSHLLTPERKRYQSPTLLYNNFAEMWNVFLFDLIITPVIISQKIIIHFSGMDCCAILMQ
jgi:hypothetical protein